MKHAHLEVNRRAHLPPPPLARPSPRSRLLMDATHTSKGLGQPPHRLSLSNGRPLPHSVCVRAQAHTARPPFDRRCNAQDPQSRLECNGQSARLAACPVPPGPTPFEGSPGVAPPLGAQSGGDPCPASPQVGRYCASLLVFSSVRTNACTTFGPTEPPSRGLRGAHPLFPIHTLPPGEATDALNHAASATFELLGPSWGCFFTQGDL